jgi:hypothetical protein
MECPSCGLTNPPDAAICDCGYDFHEKVVSGTGVWKANLAWSQELAAYWSISWPALIGSFGAVIWFTRDWSWHDLPGHSLMVWVAGTLGFYLIQAVLAQRLVRKNYRSFSLDVVREHGGRSRGLTVPEVWRLWLWIFWPQIALLVVSNVAALYFAGNADAIHGLSTVTRWIQFLVVGPKAVGFALHARYPGFSLEVRPCRNWKSAPTPQPDQSSPDSRPDR